MKLNNDSVYRRNMKEVAILIGYIDGFLEKKLREELDQGVCAIHSFGLAVNSKAYAIVGTSGSGKTTLGLSCCLKGAGFIGDEYGFLSWESGTYWHRDFPICIKAGTRSVIGARLGRCLPKISPYGVYSDIVLTDNLIHELKLVDCRNSKLPLAGIILPKRLRFKAQDVTFRRLGIKEWIALLMPSFDDGISRNGVFSNLLKLASQRDIDVFQITYGNAPDAADLFLSELVSTYKYGDCVG